MNSNKSAFYGVVLGIAIVVICSASLYRISSGIEGTKQVQEDIPISPNHYPYFEDVLEGERFFYNSVEFVKLRPVFLAGDDSYPINAFCPSFSYYVTFGNREKLDNFVESN